ncbi:putative tripartite motif-containing protein 3-like [Apostichopus japonicus]|uniref:Putative tripartite motif-containing protein 3-like n=1 Tax=Stichopus japonicus TaxID=307972 RepID=A0A2G8KL08_STIJA|nr:putative tripartite motif-containing protein 3-like [Apostichopus japonicus]
MVVQTKRFAMEGRANIVESTCGICKLGFVDPKILPCIHTFCKKCLVDNVRSAQRQSVPFSCPHCKTPHSLNKDKINALQDNYFVSTLKPDPALRKPKQDVKRNHLRLAAKRRPVSSASRIDVSIGSMKKVRCLKHPSGSVYCKTCEVFQCLMCRNNKEHRGHVLIEATDINEQFDSDDEQLSESNDIIFSVLQQQHLSGQTEEICQRAMHSVRDEASNLMEEINNRAAQVIKKIEEEKLMLLKNLTLIEAKKLQTIRQALDCANKVSRIQRNQIQSRQLPEIPSDDPYHAPAVQESKTTAKLRLESSLLTIGTTFVPYGSVRPVLGELNSVESENLATKEEVKLREKDETSSQRKLEYRHTVADLNQLPSHYNRIPEDLNQQTEGENEELPNHSENDDDDEVQQVTTSIPKENFKPQPAHRKLERLYPPKPVEHRPLPPIPAPRRILPCSPMEQ